MASEEKHNIEPPSCSSSESERQGNRKRSSPNVSSRAETESSKLYECRFCPMKFTKSQALGGHMNRHRQEREREQIINARKLLVQQDFPSIMLSGLDCCLQRSYSEGSLNHSLQFQGQSAPNNRGCLVQHNNSNDSITGHVLLAPSTNSWNITTVLENKCSNYVPTISALDQFSPLGPKFQAQLASNTPSLKMRTLEDGESLWDNSMVPINGMYVCPSYEYMVQPNIRELGFSHESNLHSSQRRGSNLQAQGRCQAMMNQQEEGEVSVSSGIDVSLMPADKLTVDHQGIYSTTKRTDKLSRGLELQQSHPSRIKNPHLYPCASSGVATKIMEWLPDASLDFNIGLGNQSIDNGVWLRGNYSTKAIPSLNSNEYGDGTIEALDPKIHMGKNGIDDDARQSKIIRWDLSLHNQYEVDEARITREFTLPGLTSSHCGIDYDAHEGEADSACSQESKIQ